METGVAYFADCQAKANFRKGVERLEACRNSVVVAAGNFGEIEADLGKANGGREIKVRDSFSVNILENNHQQADRKLVSTP